MLKDEPMRYVPSDALHAIFDGLLTVAISDMTDSSEDRSSSLRAMERAIERLPEPPCVGCENFYKCAQGFACSDYGLYIRTQADGPTEYTGDRELLPMKKIEGREVFNNKSPAKTLLGLPAIPGYRLRRNPSSRAIYLYKTKGKRYMGSFDNVEAVLAYLEISI